MTSLIFRDCQTICQKISGKDVFQIRFDLVRYVDFWYHMMLNKNVVARVIVTNQRPSYREIDKRLREAKQAVKERRVLFANGAKISGELTALDIGDTEEVWYLIERLLDELQPNDYDGKHPPQRSYEPEIADCELWAFCWPSQRIKERMYLKFAIKDNCFYYVSLHKSKLFKGTYI